MPSRVVQPGESGAVRFEAVAGDATTPSPWVPGKEFSKYEIESRLAAGGMAEVWRAKIKGAQGFEKRIVIKTILTKLQDRPDVVQMFITEAAIAAQFGHANIVHIFDFGQLEGRYFIAMEYVPGVTLRVAHKRMRARGERLPITSVLHVLADICDALEHVHEAADACGPLGLVHRDISPDNIIISTSGSAKLIDFGTARSTARTPFTRQFIGKYRYSAPERARKVSEDRRSDIWSAGVIMYECLTGKRPFEGTDQEVVNAVLASRGCDPRGLVPSIPASVAAVVVKATAQNPDDRFQTARAMREALIACLREVGTGGREREVTAALADLLEAPHAPDRTLSFVPPPEAVPEPIGAEVEEKTSTDAIALCEVEILDASGPIRNLDEPPPPVVAPLRASLPRSPPPIPPAAQVAPPVSIFAPPAAPSGTAVRGWRTRPSHARSPEEERSARERAVELFDRGVELRIGGHYGEALDAWERALALAPDNRVYQSNVARLRGELDRLRAATPETDVATALRELVAVCTSLKIGIVEASAVTESSIRVVVRECVACADIYQSGHVICHYEAGLIAGAGAAIFKRPASVQETACTGGCGDDACRFEITLS